MPTRRYVLPRYPPPSFPLLILAPWSPSSQCQYNLYLDRVATRQLQIQEENEMRERLEAETAATAAAAAAAAAKSS